MAQARRRVARALSVLRKAFDDGSVVFAVEATGRWLEEFHPRSVVELDYAGLVDLRTAARSRAAVVFCTHHPPLVRAVADRVLELAPPGPQAL